MPAMAKFNSQAIIFLLSWSSSLRPYRNNIMIIQLWPLWTTLTVDPGSWTTVFRNQGTPRQTRMSNTLLKIVDWWSSGFQIFWSVLLLRYCLDILHELWTFISERNNKCHKCHHHRTFRWHYWRPYLRAPPWPPRSLTRHLERSPKDNYGDDY